jgi:nucleotide-binding universal stress UspA family protein
VELAVNRELDMRKTDVKEVFSMQAKKLMFATDFSESSEYALSLATMLARETGGLLLIAHVSEAEQYPVGEHFDEDPKDNPAALAKLKTVIPVDDSVRYEHRLLYGEPGSVSMTQPAAVILDLAEKEDVDVIVLGTHGRSGISRTMMGSVAETVLRNSRCAAIVAKQPPLPF